MQARLARKAVVEHRDLNWTKPSIQLGLDLRNIGPSCRYSIKNCMFCQKMAASNKYRYQCGCYCNCSVHPVESFWFCRSGVLVDPRYYNANKVEKKRPMLLPSKDTRPWHIGIDLAKIDSACPTLTRQRTKDPETYSATVSHYHCQQMHLRIGQKHLR
jgi:hypothetical protein